MKAIDFKKHTYTPNEFYDYMQQIEDSMSGDLSITISPATLGSSAAVIASAISASDDDIFTRSVEVKLVNTAGDTLQWFNGTLPIAVAVETAGDGAAAIEDTATTVSFTEGVGTVVIEYSGTWTADDTCTFTVSASNAGEIMGYAITAKTSIDTVVA